MRALIVSLIAALCVGCAPSKQPQPISPSNIGPETIVLPVEPPNPIKRTDLPLNWVQVDGKGWSYGLPLGFDKKLQPAGILSSHYSVSTNITINFSTHENKKDELENYVHVFMQNIESEGGDTVAAINERLGIIAVHFIMNDKSNPNFLKSSLDFFKQKDTTIYHMTCESDAAHFAKYNDVCFDVAETLRIE